MSDSEHDFMNTLSLQSNEQRTVNALETLVAASQRTELLLTELVTLSKPKFQAPPERSPVIAAYKKSGK
jgi:hypothetical protein